MKRGVHFKWKFYEKNNHSLLMIRHLKPYATFTNTQQFWKPSIPTDSLDYSQFDELQSNTTKLLTWTQWNYLNKFTVNALRITISFFPKKRQLYDKINLASGPKLPKPNLTPTLLAALAINNYSHFKNLHLYIPNLGPDPNLKRAYDLI